MRWFSSRCRFRQRLKSAHTTLISALWEENTQKQFSRRYVCSIGIRLINHIETLDPNVFDTLLDAVVAANFSKKVPPPRKSGGEPKGHL